MKQQKTKKQTEDRKERFNEPDEYKTEEVTFERVVQTPPPLPMVYQNPWWKKLQVPIVITLFVYSLLFRS